MVNQPAFNPNDRDAVRRRRAIAIARSPTSSSRARASSRSWSRPRSTRDATRATRYRHRRRFKVGVKIIQDKHELGMIDFGEVLAKSSNVAHGEDRALARQAEQMTRRCRGSASAQVTASGFPGESAGLLSGTRNWRPIDIATHGLRLRPVGDAAAARAGLRDDRRGGLHRPVTFAAPRARPRASACCQRAVARDLIGMLERPSTPAGTGVDAPRCPAIASPARPARRGRRRPAATDAIATSRCSRGVVPASARASRSS